jgi:hypothetical protein
MLYCPFTAIQESRSLGQFSRKCKKSKLSFPAITIESKMSQRGRNV